VHPCHRIGDVRHHPHTMTIRFVSEFAEPSEHYLPNGYITYQNSATPTPQAVDPYSGQTVPPSAAHFPID
jgi:hypothetical protein